MNLLRVSRLPARFQVIPLPDGALVQLIRGNRKDGNGVRLGPNHVHAAIIHADYSVEDLGVSHNLLTNAGRDLVAAAIGSPGVNAGGSVSANLATSTSATSLTNTNAAYTVDAYKGWTVVAEESTNTPVFGNIGSNTSTALTVDAWRNADDSAGTTPGSTANYFIIPSARFRYMGLTENASAASAASTTLTGEITTGGALRSLATYAHTGATATFTLAKTFSITATFPAIHKMALFTASNTTAGGVEGYESVLNADANVVSGDSLAVTDTVTVSG